MKRDDGLNVDALKAELDRGWTSLRAAVIELVAAVGALRERQDELREQHADLARRFDTLEARVLRLEQKPTTIEAIGRPLDKLR